MGSVGVTERVRVRAIYRIAAALHGADDAPPVKPKQKREEVVAKEARCPHLVEAVQAPAAVELA